MDCSLPGSSVLGIFPPWILEWVAISSSRRKEVSCIGRQILYHWAAWQAPKLSTITILNHIEGVSWVTWAGVDREVEAVGGTERQDVHARQVAPKWEEVTSWAQSLRTVGPNLRHHGLISQKTTFSRTWAEGVVLGWFQHTTFFVCFPSHLMPLLILKEVLLHSLEVGDLWLKRLFQTRCLLGPKHFYCWGCGEQRRLGPLHVRTVASGAQAESWQGKVVTGVREADLGAAEGMHRRPQLRPHPGEPSSPQTHWTLSAQLSAWRVEFLYTHAGRRTRSAFSVCTFTSSAGAWRHLHWDARLMPCPIMESRGTTSFQTPAHGHPLASDRLLSHPLPQWLVISYYPFWLHTLTSGFTITAQGQGLLPFYISLPKSRHNSHI